MGTPAPGCNGTTYEILKRGEGKEVRDLVMFVCPTFAEMADPFVPLHHFVTADHQGLYGDGACAWSNQRDREEVLVNQGSGSDTLFVPSRRRRRDQRLGPGMPRNERRRRAETYHSRPRGLRRRWIPCLGHSAERYARVHA